MEILDNLTEIKLTKLLAGPGFTEVQSGFEVRASPGQEQKVANFIIYPATGVGMEYGYIMKDNQHKKFFKQSFLNELGRLAQGLCKIFKRTETILYHPQKEEPNQTI